MTWREPQAENRRRADDLEAVAERFDAWTAALTPADHERTWTELAAVAELRPGMAVLDAGAGAGALSLALAGHGLVLAALEPSPAMARRFAARLPDVELVVGFCDAADDVRHFPPGRFDVIASRQVANELYDPLAAFRNWHTWLTPGGRVVLIEGLFGRAGWGDREAEVDHLPLAANESRALLPYLLEQAGFTVERLAPMGGTRVPRYVVVARKAYSGL